MPILLHNVIQSLWLAIQVKQNYIMNFENAISISKEIIFFLLFVWFFLSADSALIMTDSVHKSVTVWSVHEHEHLSESNSFLQPAPHEYLKLYLS